MSTTTCPRCQSVDTAEDRNPVAADLGWQHCSSCGFSFKSTSLTRLHGDHDPLPYDGHNADLGHLCQICGQPMDKQVAAPQAEEQSA